MNSQRRYMMPLLLVALFLGYLAIERSKAPRPPAAKAIPFAAFDPAVCSRDTVAGYAAKFGLGEPSTVLRHDTFTEYTWQWGPTAAVRVQAHNDGDTIFRLAPLFAP